LEGRLKKYVKPSTEEENGDNEKQDGDGENEINPEEAEEIIPILTSITSNQSKEFSISEDKEYSNAWYSRESGKNTSFHLIALHNKNWPGSKTIYLNNSKQFVNIYVGEGLKYCQHFYSPTLLPTLQQQFVEYKEIEVEEEKVSEENEENADNEPRKKIVKEPIFVLQSEQVKPVDAPQPSDPEKEENTEEQN